MFNNKFSIDLFLERQTEMITNSFISSYTTNFKSTEWSFKKL